MIGLYTTQLVYWIITWLSKCCSGLWNWRHWRTTACIKIIVYIYVCVCKHIYIYTCTCIKVLQNYTNRTTQASPSPAPLCPDSSVKNVSVSPLCLSVWAKHVALRGSFFFKHPTKKLKSCKEKEPPPQQHTTLPSLTSINSPKMEAQDLPAHKGIQISGPPRYDCLG